MRKRTKTELPATTTVAEDLQHLAGMTTYFAQAIQLLEVTLKAFQSKWVKQGIGLAGILQTERKRTFLGEE